MKRDSSYMLGNKFAVGSKPNQTAFKKGNVPWNKNIKGTHFSPQTEFKKNGTGITHLDVGTITIRSSKKDKKRNWIKIEEPNKWIPYANYVWINNYGDIPKGCVIHHIDGDSLHDVIENLALLTRSDHFYIHKIDEIGRKARQSKAA